MIKLYIYAWHIYFTENLEDFLRFLLKSSLETSKNSFRNKQKPSGINLMLMHIELGNITILSFIAILKCHDN